MILPPDRSVFGLLSCASCLVLQSAFLPSCVPSPRPVPVLGHTCLRFANHHPGFILPWSSRLSALPCSPATLLLLVLNLLEGFLWTLDLLTSPWSAEFCLADLPSAHAPPLRRLASDPRSLPRVAVAPCT